jgi:hypothetical protein
MHTACGPRRRQVEIEVQGSKAGKRGIDEIRNADHAGGKIDALLRIAIVRNDMLAYCNLARCLRTGIRGAA